MFFQMLHTRLVNHMRARVRSGELTERRLARLTRVSQPHLHNVLKGVRLLSPEMADQVLVELQLNALDLLDQNDLHAPRGAVLSEPYAEAPLIEGWLGPGHGFPDTGRRSGALPFLRVELAGIVQPLAVRLAHDAQERLLFRGGDVALLAPFPENCRAPVGEDGRTYYALNLVGSSLIRRVQRRGNLLFLMTEQEGAGALCIALADRNILEVVRARVIWIGRYLERSWIADRPFEEAGGKDRPPGAEG
jgi:hypothetical protein